MRTAIRVDSFKGANVVRAVEFGSVGRGGLLPGKLAASPIATRLGELISAKQIQILGRISRSAGIDVDHLAGQLFECDTSELSKSGAETLIGVLEKMSAEMESRRHLRLTG